MRGMENLAHLFVGVIGVRGSYGAGRMNFLVVGGDLSKNKQTNNNNKQTSKKHI